VKLAMALSPRSWAEWCLWVAVPMTLVALALPLVSARAPGRRISFALVDVLFSLVWTVAAAAIALSGAIAIRRSWPRPVLLVPFCSAVLTLLFATAALFLVRVADRLIGVAGGGDAASATAGVGAWILAAAGGLALVGAVGGALRRPPRPLPQAQGLT
jgi:hypothetical protein